ncbi:MAG TPA: hypothetical protein VN038_02535, partial [Dyadobacter sp.]|nr:hypothetical protein [Dyadobacter sp.]
RSAAYQSKQKLFSGSAHDFVNNPFVGYFFMHNFKGFCELNNSKTNSILLPGRVFKTAGHVSAWPAFYKTYFSFNP